MAIIGTAIVAVVLGALLLRGRRGRIERARTAEAAAAAERERRRALEESGVTFSAHAWVPFGSPDEPDEAPLILEVHGALAWVHDVRLSFGSRDRGPRSAVADMPCKPWDGRVPARLHPEGDLKLDWPGPRLLEPEPISWELEVVWSVEPDGPVARSIVPGGNTDWRRAGSPTPAQASPQRSVRGVHLAPDAPSDSHDRSSTRRTR